MRRQGGVANMPHAPRRLRPMRRQGVVAFLQQSPRRSHPIGDDSRYSTYSKLDMFVELCADISRLFLRELRRTLAMIN